MSIQSEIGNVGTVLKAMNVNSYANIDQGRRRRYAVPLQKGVRWSDKRKHLFSPILAGTYMHGTVLFMHAVCNGSY